MKNKSQQIYSYTNLYLEDERVEVRVSRLHFRVLGHGSPALPVQQTHVVLKDKISSLYYTYKELYQRLLKPV